MIDSQIETLLIVQHHDTALLKVQQAIAQLPARQKALEAAIEEETAKMETARQALRTKELTSKELEIEVKSKESALLKFRTQQNAVKKNDEYKALSHQIEQTQADIESLEEREIELLLEIDQAKEKCAAEEAEIKKRIEVHRQEISLLNERKIHLNTALEDAQAKVEKSRVDVDPLYLEHYDRVKKIVKRTPYVALIKAQTCSGCHLRVSNDVARAIVNANEPHFCDQCTRMVYA